MFFVVGAGLGLVVVLAVMGIWANQSSGDDYGYDYTDQTGPMELPGVTLDHGQELDELLVAIHAHQVVRKTITKLHVHDFIKDGIDGKRMDHRRHAMSLAIQKITKNLTAEIASLQRRVVEKQKKFGGKG